MSPGRDAPKPQEYPSDRARAHVGHARTPGGCYGEHEAQRDLLHRRQRVSRLQRQAVAVQNEHHGRERGNTELKINQ